MGLAIMAYEHAALTPPHERTDDEGNYCGNELGWYGGKGHVYANVDHGFDHALGSLQQGRCYVTSGDTYDFQAGSYSGYGYWRAVLCENALGVPPQIVWSSPEKFVERPFFHLINFSDCEGTIGPEICRKLATDFRMHNGKLALFNGDFEDWIADKYQDWQEAFTLAQEDGLVLFR